MKRRIYKLKTKFTLLGMEAVDWGVIVGTFAVSLNLLDAVLGSRVALLLSLVLTALVYFVWHLVKDNVPEHFSTHLLKWLGEPEVYKVVPDLQNVPLFVDFEEVQRVTGKGEVRGQHNPFTDQLHTSSPRPQNIKPRPTFKLKPRPNESPQPSPHTQQES